MLTWDVCVLRLTICERSFDVCLAGAEYLSWLRQFDQGQLHHDLRRATRQRMRRRLRRVPRSVRRTQALQPSRVGIEHEFEVFGIDERGTAHTTKLDFRRILPDLFTDHVRADPADPFAVRLDDFVITADGPEAEIADRADHLRAGLQRAQRRGSGSGSVGARDGVRGADHRRVLDHISVSWRPKHDDQLARTWARVFGPAMMLLLDRTSSPGLIVRPRPGRLELCGDFCVGERLAAAVAFAAASARATESIPARVLRGLSVDVCLEPAVQRYGWFVDRRAFGCDLYTEGPAALLHRNDVPLTAGTHLDDMIELVKPSLTEFGGAARHRAAGMRARSNPVTPDPQDGDTMSEYFRSTGDPNDLLPRERAPLTAGRVPKRRSKQNDGSQHLAPGRPKWLPVAAVGLAAAAVAGIVAVASGSGDGGSDRANDSSTVGVTAPAVDTAAITVTTPTDAITVPATTAPATTVAAVTSAAAVTTTPPTPTSVLAAAEPVRLRSTVPATSVQVTPVRPECHRELRRATPGVQHGDQTAPRTRAASACARSHPARSRRTGCLTVDAVGGHIAFTNQNVDDCHGGQGSTYIRTITSTIGPDAGRQPGGGRPQRPVDHQRHAS